MAANNLKTWKQEHGLLTSPRFPDKSSFEKCKKFLIRVGIHADSDDMARIIIVNIKGDGGRGNLEKLKKMEIL